MKKVILLALLGLLVLAGCGSMTQSKDPQALQKQQDAFLARHGI